VQAELERAIESVTGKLPRITAAGRTDAGAHALGQVIAFGTESHLPEESLELAINARLPRDIVVRDLREVAHSFHPRFDARSRTYRYVIWNAPQRSPLLSDRAAHIRKPLDVERMNRALRLIVGRHDFTTFVSSSAVGRRMREIICASVERHGGEIWVELEGNGFMRQMIRSIVGTLIDVGLGRISVEEFDEIARSGDRSRAGATAPARGLYLLSVQYAEEADRRSAHAEELL